MLAGRAVKDDRKHLVATIHPSAVVSPLAELGRDVVVGPFCTIEAGAIVGDGCRLEARVTVKEGTTLGIHNEIGEGAVIGGRAQHVHNGPIGGKLIIGDHNKIREYCTLHRAFKPEDCTRIGSHNMFMVGAHVAHDCQLGNHIVTVNNVLYGGHVHVGDRAFVGGGSAVHQFCRIGTFAMIGGHTKLVKDVPPFMTVDGTPAHVVGLNKVGLRRAGVEAAAIQQLKESYRLIYRRGLRWTEVLAALKSDFSAEPAAALLQFFQASKRGFTPERRTPKAAMLRLVNAAEDTDQRQTEAA
jgi:UDP-N-acetylglucosamine acyltransferase